MLGKLNCLYICKDLNSELIMHKAHKNVLAIFYTVEV